MIVFNAAEGAARWHKLAVPKCYHRAAYEAWKHEPSGALLLLFWFPHPREAGEGNYEWTFRAVAGGRRATAYIDLEAIAGPSAVQAWGDEQLAKLAAAGKEGT